MRAWVRSCTRAWYEYDRDHCARGLTADVLAENSRMLRVFERGDHSFSVEIEAGSPT